MATAEREQDPEVFAQHLSDRFLHCRELGHNWRPWTAEYDRKSRTYSRVLKCSGCRTERHQALDSTGTVVGNHYTYSDGYLAKNVQRGVRRDVFRLEAVLRFLDKSQQKAG
jgi:hypothetical protein